MMKKALISAVVLSALISPFQIANAQGTVKATPCYTNSKVAIKTPNLLNSKTINELKSGTYIFNGITKDMTIKDVKKKLGQPKKETVAQAETGKILTLHYSQTDITFFSTNRYEKNEAMKILDIEYKLNKQQLEYKILREKLGKPLDTTKGVDVIYTLYDNFSVEYYKINNRWIAVNIAMDINKEPEITPATIKKNIRKSVFNDQTNYVISNSDIKNMAKGTLSLNGVKLNMTQKEVYKAIGQSYQDVMITTPKGKKLRQDYVDFTQMTFQYNANNCESVQHLQSITFDYALRGLTFNKIESLVGKPDKVVQGKLTTTLVDNKDVKVPTRTNTYGHLTVKGELVKGKYRVLKLVYK